MDSKDLQFSLIFETENRILAEIHNLDNKKASHESDISVNIAKDNKYIFSELVFHNFSNRYLMWLSLQNWQIQMWFRFRLE